MHFRYCADIYFSCTIFYCTKCILLISRISDTHWCLCFGSLTFFILHIIWSMCLWVSFQNVAVCLFTLVWLAGIYCSSFQAFTAVYLTSSLFCVVAWHRLLCYPCFCRVFWSHVQLWRCPSLATNLLTFATGPGYH